MMFDCKIRYISFILEDAPRQCQSVFSMSAGDTGARQRTGDGVGVEGDDQLVICLSVIFRQL